MERSDPDPYKIHPRGELRKLKELADLAGGKQDIASFRKPYSQRSEEVAPPRDQQRGPVHATRNPDFQREGTQFADLNGLPDLIPALRIPSLWMLHSPVNGIVGRA